MMLELKLITCIVQRGKADEVVGAAMDAGAAGATIFYGRGTGVRQRLGIAGNLISPQKEIILIATQAGHAEAVFAEVVKVAKLGEKGQGFAFMHNIQQAVGFLEDG